MAGLVLLTKAFISWVKGKGAAVVWEVVVESTLDEHRERVTTENVW